jgi:ABC-type branched-subunit amino acid transport system substrate-binding protein
LAAFGAIGKAEAGYFDVINARGGINGRKIRFISYDDSSDPRTALEQTRKLVEQDEVAAGVIGYLGWTISNADVPMSGYVAMALGVVFSLAVGVGLMALVFYSSREGFDEPAMLIPGPDEAKELETRLEQKR